MIFLRSFIFNAAYNFNLFCLVIGGTPTLIFGRHAVQGLGRLWARSSFWLLDKICGAKLEFRGLEHLPPGACIIASKHQSVFETFALTTKTSDFVFVLKRELTMIPFFGWYLKGCDMIAIDRAKRGTVLAQITPRVREALAEGRKFIIFPEGTRRPVGAPPQYKSGVAHLYAATGAVCIPVALNTGVFWPRRGFLRRPGRIVIEFLEPIAPGLDKETFMRTLQTRVETATDRLVAEALNGDPPLRAATCAVQSASPA